MHCCAEKISRETSDQIKISASGSQKIVIGERTNRQLVNLAERDEKAQSGDEDDTLQDHASYHMRRHAQDHSLHRSNENTWKRTRCGRRHWLHFVKYLPHHLAKLTWKFGSFKRGVQMSIAMIYIFAAGDDERMVSFTVVMTHDGIFGRLNLVLLQTSLDFFGIFLCFDDVGLSGRTGSKTRKNNTQHNVRGRILLASNTALSKRHNYIVTNNSGKNNSKIEGFIPSEKYKPQSSLKSSTRKEASFLSTIDKKLDCVCECVCPKMSLLLLLL